MNSLAVGISLVLALLCLLRNLRQPKHSAAFRPTGQPMPISGKYVVRPRILARSSTSKWPAPGWESRNTGACVAHWKPQLDRLSPNVRQASLTSPGGGFHRC